MILDKAASSSPGFPAQSWNTLIWDAWLAPPQGRCSRIVNKDGVGGRGRGQGEPREGSYNDNDGDCVKRMRLLFPEINVSSGENYPIGR